MKVQLLFLVSLIAPCLAAKNVPLKQCEITIGPETFSKSILFRGLPGKRGPMGPPGPAGGQGGSCECSAGVTKLLNKLELERINKNMESLTKQVNELNAINSQLNETLIELTAIQEKFKVKDCSYVRNENKDGVFDIYPKPSSSVRAMCDMTTTPGGWTVIQRRYNGKVDFYRSWYDYKYGFGDVRGEHWLGLEQIHEITKDGNYMLRIDLEDRTGDVGYVTYSTFVVGSEETNYRLQISGYAGNIGDSLTRGSHNLDGMMFSTFDQDNDERINSNCAADNNHGAWWFRDCSVSNLNGDYSVESGWKGLRWYYWKNSSKTMKTTKMMIRPKVY